MGEQVKEFGNTITSRWKNRMPKFFRVIFMVCSLTSGTAIAINTAILAAGSTPHEWWNELMPYLIGIPAGMAFVAKFTQSYGVDGRPIEYDDMRKAEKGGNTILDKDNF